MNIGNDSVTVVLTTDLDAVVEVLVTKGGYEPEQLRPLEAWLERGDDILVFANHDLGSLASHPLYWSMPWERDEPTPRQAPDTSQCGLGWRYLPEYRVTVAS
jgi:hypothetical protein